ncbi:MULTISPECIES: membrane protein insertion efficiency factor YidD [unclassified Vibrio]|uniref:membrane protein insertion efficiency factor YidD n=1 Tax=unclassified Vibrio TaxID=2614977 RepID=UPI0009ECFD8E|nr:MULTISPECIES: membrane protein insertion efficiency factor YidD [unclassified Vibrio]
MLKIISLVLIDRYQAGGGSKRYFNTECNFEPTCSEYTKQSIEKYGTMKGWKLGLARIKRCNQPNLTKKIVDNVP